MPDSKSTNAGDRRSPFANLSQTVGTLARQSRESQALEEARAQGRDGRGKPANAGTLGQDNQGVTKATYALPVRRQELVREMATAEDCSQTDVVEAAIVALYNAWQAGRLDLSGLKTPIKSLRFSWHLEIPDDFFLG